MGKVLQILVFFIALCTLFYINYTNIFECHLRLKNLVPPFFIGGWIFKRCTLIFLLVTGRSWKGDWKLQLFEVWNRRRLVSRIQQAGNLISIITSINKNKPRVVVGSLILVDYCTPKRFLEHCFQYRSFECQARSWHGFQPSMLCKLSNVMIYQCVCVCLWLELEWNKKGPCNVVMKSLCTCLFGDMTFMWHKI